MITRIEIDGFKTFDDFSLDVPPFLVLLGANGSGKSNLLEAVALLGRLVKDPRSQTLVRYARRSGPRELFRRGPEGGLAEEMRLSAQVLVRSVLRGAAHVRIDMRVGYRDAPEPLLVEARFTTLGSAGLELPAEVAEQIDFNAGRRVRDSAGAEMTSRFEREIFHAARRAALQWRILDPVPEAMRQPADAYDSDPLGEDGGNLGAVLGRLWQGPPERKADFEADVAALLPDIRHVEVSQDEERAQWNIWIQHKHEPRMAARVVSGGTLRALALLAAAHDSVTSGVLMLEEPENGLHPSRVPRLLERLRGQTSDLGGFAPRTWHDMFDKDDEGLRQILVTSHSPVVLASVLDKAPDDVVFLDTVTRMGGGRTPARLTRARKVAESGERGKYVTPMEVRQYLNPVGYAHGA